MARLFTDADFLPGRIWPGKVRLDEVFHLDPDKSFEDQKYEYREDMLLVEFPNGCALDLGWYPSFNPAGEFRVSVAQREVDQNWEPFITRACHSIPEMRSIVMELVEVAKVRPSIERRLFEYGDPTDWIKGARNGDYNELILDPLSPLGSQTPRLKKLLFQAVWSSEDRLMTIGWEPPHDPKGEFAISLWSDPVDFWARLLECAEKGTIDTARMNLLKQWRCKSISELRAVVKEATDIVLQGQKKESPSDGR